MNRYKTTGVVALSLALAAAGCDSFLTGPGLTENPNNATGASITAQFVAFQAGTFTRLEGQLARFAGIFTQQIIGSNNQQLSQGTQYLVVEGDINTYMSGLYTGTGLAGLRNVQALAKEAGDAKWEGIAKIWEAYTIGTAASLWGDLPYSEAVDPDVLTPKLDPQEQIYTRVQELLDEGIGLLSGPGAGPGAADLIYGGNVDRWRRAAYTLKARFHLHLAEREGRSRYEAALAAAANGINEAPTSVAQAMHGQAPGDFTNWHGTDKNRDANVWSQFLGERQDIVAGHVLVSLLKSRNDPRLTAYFDPTPAGDVFGMDADAKVVGSTAASVINISVRRAPNFRQPMVTWAENELIMAEAKHATDDPAGALVHVNNVRRALGMPELASVTFEQVMEEKYIAMFQNIEVWNDWKRTCIPQLKPHGTHEEVIGRLPYGSGERTNNPNIPLPSQQPKRNWNDPNPCPRP